MAFEVIFSGVLRDGFSRRQGIDTLCHKFGLNFDQVKLLLSDPGRVVKRAETRPQAEKVVQTLWDGGWHSELLLNQRVIFSTRESKSCMKRQYSADSSISVCLPPSWQLCNDLNPQALLQAGNRQEHYYIVILSQARRELPPALTLASYAAAQLQQCVEKVTGGRLLSGPEEIESASLPLCVSEMSAQLGETAIRYLVAHYQSEQSFYTIFLWCEDRHYSQEKELFNQIVLSFCLETNVSQTKEDNVEVTESL